jgi:hypothetical protein
VWRYAGRWLLDLLAKIYSLHAVLFSDEMLRWSESAAMKIWAVGYSINKGPLSCGEFKLLWVVYLLSPVGRGGGGEVEMRLFRELRSGDYTGELLRSRFSSSSAED